MSQAKTRGKGSKRQKNNKGRGVKVQQPQAMGSTAPMLAQAVSAEILILEEELAKVRETGDSAAICRYTETIANIKAKSVAMAFQMDATLRKILSAKMPAQMPAGMGGKVPLAAVSDTLESAEEIVEEAPEEDASESEDEEGDPEGEGEDGDLSEGESDAGGDAPNSGPE